MEKKSEVKEENQVRKLSYEELENVAQQLSVQAQQVNAQNQKLRQLLEEANLSNLYKRLDYLFKVLSDTALFSKEFVSYCSSEIEEILGESKDKEENNTTSE